MSENYVKVDVLKYVKEGLESGILVPFEAEKFARPHGLLVKKLSLGVKTKTEIQLRKKLLQLNLMKRLGDLVGL